MEQEAVKHEAQVEDVGPCKKQVRITIPSERVREEIDKQYTEIIQNTQFPGFRKGRVPRKLVEKRFGDQILQDVKQTLVSETFEKTLEDHALDPIGDPEIEYESIEIRPEENLVFDVTVEVKPIFDLPDYKGMEIERAVADVSDSDVDEALERFAKSRATYAPSTAKQIRADDLLVADTALIQGDETIFEQENDQFIPEHKQLYGIPVEDLPARMKGAKIDEPTEIPTEIPEGAARGKVRPGEALLRVVPREIKRMKVPKVDAKLAESLDFDSLDELRDNVRKQLVQDAEREADRAVEDRILEKLLEAASFDLPEGIVERELEHVLERERIRLQLDGTSDETELDRKLEESRPRLQEGIRTRLKKAFLLEKVAAKEKVFVTEEMVEAAIAGIAARQGKTPDQIREWFEGRGQLGELRAELRERMTREALRKAAKMTDKKG
jgi:trigger factor